MNVRRLLGVVLPPILAFSLLFGCWEAAVRIFDVKRIILPRPSQIAATLVKDPGFWFGHSVATAREAVLGFAAAALAAFLLAVAIIHVQAFERALVPVITMVQVTPIIALGPPLVIWLGFGLAPKVVMAALVCLVPFTVSAVSGLRSVDADTLELLRSVDASRMEIFTRLRVPHALPSLCGAARIGVGLSLVGALVAEWSGSSEGLGYVMAKAQNSFLTTQVWGAVVVLAVEGMFGVTVIRLIETRLLRWHPGAVRR